MYALDSPTYAATACSRHCRASFCTWRILQGESPGVSTHAYGHFSVFVSKLLTLKADSTGILTVHRTCPLGRGRCLKQRPLPICEQSQEKKGENFQMRRLVSALKDEQRQRDLDSRGATPVMLPSYTNQRPPHVKHSKY